MNKEEIEREIRNTIKGLTDIEDKNTTSFQNWPEILRTSYELEPEKRHFGSRHTATGIPS